MKKKKKIIFIDLYSQYAYCRNTAYKEYVNIAKTSHQIFVLETIQTIWAWEKIDGYTLFKHKNR